MLSRYLDAIQRLFKPWLIDLPNGTHVIAETGDGRAWYYIAANGAVVRIDKPEEFGRGPVTGFELSVSRN
jgi:hypothetical protein